MRVQLGAIVWLSSVGSASTLSPIHMHTPSHRASYLRTSSTALHAWWEEPLPYSRHRQGKHVRRPATTALEPDAHASAPAHSAPPDNTYGLLSLSGTELTRVIGGAGRARTAWKALRLGLSPSRDSGVLGLGLGSPAKKVLEHLETCIPQLATDPRGHEDVLDNSPFQGSGVKVSSDGTAKLLLRLGDGRLVETVLIPNQKTNHTTICVSSEVGCGRACAFCRTGEMGYVRGLSSEEILGQVYHGVRIANTLGMPKLDHAVFMGMGEPLNNIHNVRRALEVMTDPIFGFKFAKTHITVSTVGPSPSIMKRAHDLPAMLAWSVHSSIDEKRRQLVPTTVHRMVELRDALSSALEGRSRSLRTLMIEVTMLQFVNDSPEDARHLASFLQPLNDKYKVCVNLIPYNDMGHPTFQRSSRERVNAFQKLLRESGLVCFVRVTRGDDELAACGQLATKTWTNLVKEGHVGEAGSLFREKPQ